MSLFEYKENNQTKWRFYLNLRSKINPSIRLQRRAAGFSSKKKALKAERKMLLQMTSELYLRENEGSTWGDIVNSWEYFYEKYPSQKYTLSTVRDYASLMRNWTPLWLKRSASELNRGDGFSLLSYVEKLGKTHTFQKRLKSTINVIFNWGIDHGHILNSKHSPVYGIEVQSKKQEPLPEILTHEQVQKLLYEAKVRHHPWYPIWAVTVLTGCRNGEVFGLRQEDIDLIPEEEATQQMNLPPEKRSFGLIRLTRAWNSRFKIYGPLKGRYWRNVPVSSELYWVLKELMCIDFGSDTHGKFLLPHFPEWKDGEQAKILRNFCREISIPPVRFHTLRACFATHLISRGVPSATVMKICGWRELKTAERYIRLAGVDERGATEGLGFIPTEQGVVEKVVSLYDFKARS